MSRRDCICGARHRNDCICQGLLPGEQEPRKHDAISPADQAAAEAILESMQGPQFQQATDAVFAMTSEELGQAAVDGARTRQEKGLPPS